MVVGLPFFGPKEGRENDDSPMDLGSVVLDVSPADPGDPLCERLLPWSISIPSGKIEKKLWKITIFNG